jgi:uncharacterized membrane protein
MRRFEGRPFQVLSHVRSSLWFVPVLCVGAGVALSFVTVWIDEQSGYSLVSQSLTGGPDAALAVLGAVATSMVSLAALVLTITMVVVQPILKDRPSQFAIGIFVGTFAFAMLAMRQVLIGSSGNSGQVPGLTVIVAYLLVVVSIAVLVVYVHHIGRSLRVSALIELVGSDTRSLLDDVYPDDGMGERNDRPGDCIMSPRSGVLVHVDYDRLVEVACDADCRIEVVPALGEFVAAGAPLLRVDGERSRLPAGIDRTLQLALERTLDQDVAYGFRMLVDIAERSLADSPYLDPTTAVQAIDRLHDNLRHLSRRHLPDGVHRDRDGRPRLTVPVMTWDAYVHLAFDEIRQVGAGSPQVARRLRSAFEDLLSYAPPERRAVVGDQLRLLDLAIQEQVPEHEQFAYLVADRQGIGAAAGNGASPAHRVGARP